MYLITGVAGFIGSAIAKRLLDQNQVVIGADNLNSYYDPNLKVSRLRTLKLDNFEIDVGDFRAVFRIFQNFKPKVVIHMAAQAGVEYAIREPKMYMDSNILGFFNVLECCRRYNAKLVYASSSSVYGKTKLPWKEGSSNPQSWYGLTKSIDEEMAAMYYRVYNMKSLGLRYFTVYGPWGRPDMSMHKFAEAIYGDKQVTVYGKDTTRDYTYIDDAADATMALIKLGTDSMVVNVGSGSPVKLTRVVEIMGEKIGSTPKVQHLQQESWDLPATHANMELLERLTGYKPSTTIEDGIQRYLEWWKSYYGGK